MIMMKTPAMLHTAGVFYFRLNLPKVKFSKL